MAEFLQKRVFEPLGMEDTFFTVPQEKLPRLAQMYAPDGTGGLKPAHPLQSYRFVNSSNRFYSGGGLCSTAMSESIVGVRLSDGELLWRYPHKVYAEENITTPVFHEGFLIVSGCVRKGTTSLRLRVSGDECSVERHWLNRTLDNKQGGIVLLDDRLYGYAEAQSRTAPWMCIDFNSGETIFQSAPLQSSYKYKNGCLTCADGMFYLYADNGNLCLARPTDEGFEVAGRLRIDDPGTRPTWAHPVVFGGRLYIRYGDKLGVYNVAGGVDQKEDPGDL